MTQSRQTAPAIPARLLFQLPLAAAISAILAHGPLAYGAPAADESGGLEEIVVTAQKRVENLQDVPVSIEVLDGQRLAQLNVVSLDGYVKLSPSVSYSRAEGQGGNGQPGTSHIYMRGVVSGANENHSGSQPSVGTYLDEQPVTTIDGTPDVHIYDVQRIEVLEGPQGTLYGASSEAGTVRIITNKPDTTKFEAGVDGGVNHVQHGSGIGYTTEGFVNIPLASFAAVRLVGWYEKDMGYIDNVAGTNAAACINGGVRSFPSWAAANGFTALDGNGCATGAPIGAGSISNSKYVKDDYNTVYIRGGRAAVKFDLGDNWTVLPTFMGQGTNTEGFFGYDPTVGDLQVAHFGPEYSTDTWTQTALTVNGKFADFDLTYAGAYMKRTTHSIAEYSDYSEFYDKLYGSGAYWTDHAGKPVMPQELVIGKGYFEKWSHELRVSSPQDYFLRGMVGGFIQRQLHDITQQYTMPGYGFTNPYGSPDSPTPNPDGFDNALSIPGYANTIWLTDEQRVDRDKAVFAQASWDIVSSLTLNLGYRYFWYDNSLQGFYGYSAAYSSGTGQVNCFAPAITPFSPCTDLDKTVSGHGNVPRVNLSYKITPDIMVYGTYSKGFRPGGVNRTAAAGIGPYQADYLKNYEIGWKTQWFDHKVRWNGAIFREDWNNFQFSFLGPNSVTIIENGGNARIKGIENEIEYSPQRQLDLSLNFTFLDPVLTENYCGVAGVTNCADPITPAGTNLPISPKFKGNTQVRYSFDPVLGWSPFGQAAFVYQSKSRSQFRNDLEAFAGYQPAYGNLDLIGGASNSVGTTIQFMVMNATDKRAELSRFSACSPDVCQQNYIIPSQPRTIGVKVSQKF